MASGLTRSAKPRAPHRSAGVVGSRRRSSPGWREARRGSSRPRRFAGGAPGLRRGGRRARVAQSFPIVSRVLWSFDATRTNEPGQRARARAMSGRPAAAAGARPRSRAGDRSNLTTAGAVSRLQGRRARPGKMSHATSSLLRLASISETTIAVRSTPDTRGRCFSNSSSCNSAAFRIPSVSYGGWRRKGGFREGST